MVRKKGKLTTPEIDEHEALTFHPLDPKKVFEEPEPTPEPELPSEPVKTRYTRDEAIHTIASYECESSTHSQVYEMLTGAILPLPFKTNAVLAKILADWLGLEQVEVYSTNDCVKRWYVSAESRV
jgi:hypothetical protein